MLSFDGVNQQLHTHRIYFFFFFHRLRKWIICLLLDVVYCCFVCPPDWSVWYMLSSLNKPLVSGSWCLIFSCTSYRRGYTPHWIESRNGYTWDILFVGVGQIVFVCVCMCVETHKSKIWMWLHLRVVTIFPLFLNQCNPCCFELSWWNSL